MKNRKYLLFLWLVGISLLFGCGLGLKTFESNFIVRISGTTGLKFKGHYAIAATAANPKLQNVEGTVPTEYSGKGLMALCLFRKNASPGSLKVEIVKDEKVVAQGETLLPYGVVSLKTSIPGSDNIFIQFLRKIIG